MPIARKYGIISSTRILIMDPRAGGRERFDDYRSVSSWVLFLLISSWRTGRKRDRFSQNKTGVCPRRRAIKLSIRTFVQAWINARREGGLDVPARKNRTGGPEKRLRSVRELRVAGCENEWEFLAAAPRVSAYPAVRPPRLGERGVPRRKRGRPREIYLALHYRK